MKRKYVGSVSRATKSCDHRYFYFDGKRVGNIGNDGVERGDYAQQLARSANATLLSEPDDGFGPYGASVPSTTVGQERTFGPSFP
jgi:hypothetical protein